MIPNPLWFVFAAAALVGGIGMVASRNPVSSLLFLVTTLFSLAGIYVLLDAQFIAAVQVIVYAGAIMVLFLFVIMLLNLGHDFRPDVRRIGWVVAGAVVAGLIGWVLAVTVTRPGLLPGESGGLLVDRAVREVGAVAAVGIPLFRDFAVPFEITSVLLLVAAIGAVLLAKRRV
jgi:NADH-quinone oxidoreductase subunit J